jgi:hypothetical protein
MRFFLTATMFLAVTIAVAQTPDSRPCAEFLKNPLYYYGPDDQVLGLSSFSDTPIYPIQSAIPYIKRMASYLRARGILPIIAFTPPEGIAYLGKLDAATIKGTAFEKLSSPANLQNILKGYQETLKAFSGAGFETPDLASGLAGYMKTNPTEIAYFKRDWHWTAVGAKAGAYAVMNFLNAKYPSLSKELQTRKITVGVKGTAPHLSPGGWDNEIRKFCPDYKPAVEMRAVLEVNQPEENPSTALFRDERFDVALVGTSFSAGQFGPGFAPYLSEALGTNVLNAGVSNAGPLGAMNEWALKLKPELLPRVLIWEMPRGYIASRDTNNPLTPIMLRQIMPLLVPNPIAIHSLTVPLKRLTLVDLPSLNTQVDFIRVTFDSFLTRKFRATLIFEDRAEDIDFVRPAGTNLSEFAIELISPAPLQRVVIETFEPIKGNVTLETGRYSR